MNSLATLYFPGTSLNRLSRYPIFLLFQNVHLLSPVEDGSEGEGDESPDIFIKSGFCQVHSPCPLGPDRNRFLRLVADITSGKEEYAAQLSSLTLAAMTANPDQGEETERSIISSFMGKMDLPQKIEEKTETDRLWQARLVLAIGEILDRQEEEIALNLAVLEDEEKNLFKELQGEEETEEDNPFGELSRLADNLLAHSTGNAKNRWKAWQSFFLAGNVGEYQVFLAASKAAGDILLEAYTERTKQAAPLVIGLQLPAFVGWNHDEASAAVLRFSETNSALLSTLQQKLSDLLHQGEEREQLLLIGESWQALLQDAFPAEQYGRVPINIYLFQGISCATLVGKNPTGNSPNSHGLLAVLG